MADFGGMETMISVTEAHERFGDLTSIRNGVTTWIQVETPEGIWKPVFQGIWFLIGYELSKRNLK